MLIAQFKNAFPWIKYKLFKSFCMPLYGMQLWNLSGREINSFYTAWRKCIRRLFNIPSRTHNVLLNIICEDFPITMQLHNRFLKFIHSVITNDNYCIQLCGKLVMNGSHSTACDNLNYICNSYTIDKYQLPKLKISGLINRIRKSYIDKISVEDLSKSSLVSDLLYYREFKHTSFLSTDEINVMLLSVCTE